MRRTIVALLLAALVVAGGFTAYELIYVQGPCNPNQSAMATQSIQKTNFGAVTEYALPTPDRWANGIMAGTDGSVWFGEQGLPGIARISPTTGTLVEYKWPCYPSKSGGVLSNVWGISSWEGKIWAADGDANRLVGVNPDDGTTTFVNTTSAQFPYLLSSGPDGDLWFTSLVTPARIGRLAPDLGLTIHYVEGLGKKEPIQIQFVNSSLGYLVALDPYTSTDSGLYSFDPREGAGNITVTQVGKGYSLFYPQSLSVEGDSIWVAQHFPSNVARYDTSSGNWTVYPTSTLSYPGHPSTTLPYFVQATQDGVWFNEHYGNRIAMLDTSAGTLTEYSESNPPVANSTDIQNDLTIAKSPGGLWFTSATGNYVGFVADGPVPFSVAIEGPRSGTLTLGGSLSLTLRVSGTWTTALTVQTSDSELSTSVPKNITMTPSETSLPAGCSSCSEIVFAVTGNGNLAAGRYTLAFTVSDGLVSQTAYFFVSVP